MRYFISDTHFGDERLPLYGRQLVAASAAEMDQLLITTWNKIVTPADEVYLLGDVAYQPHGLPLVGLLNGTKHLVRGNYDLQANAELEPYFATICDNVVLYIGGEPVYLNHFPSKARADYFNLVGHVHGTWKVQRNMINVSCDAWHFCPISEAMIAFQMNGIRNHYDINVFAGELGANLKLEYNYGTR